MGVGCGCCHFFGDCASGRFLAAVCHPAISGRSQVPALLARGWCLSVSRLVLSSGGACYYFTWASPKLKYRFGIMSELARLHFTLSHIFFNIYSSYKVSLKYCIMILFHFFYYYIRIQSFLV